MTALPTTKPRSDSASSRNDLFNTSWAPELRPPRPLGLPTPPPPPAQALLSGSPRFGATVPVGSGSGSGFLSTPGSGPSTLPRLKRDGPGPGYREGESGISEFGTALPSTSASASTAAQSSSTVPGPGPTPSSRTSSFFDKPTELPVPPSRSSILPTPPSPLSLSRSSSIKHRPPPLPLDLGTSPSHRITSNGTGSNNTLFHPRAQPQTPPIDSEPLSPLHQSPSLPATISDWSLPPPPVSDDIALRLNARSMYLLGEGRYATVFLASYKKDQRGEGRRKDRRRDSDNPNPFQNYDPSSHFRFINPSSSVTKQAHGEREGEAGAEVTMEEVNADGNGYTNGSWRLCAAKRMAPDRQSQTMGLREAFFLNRLSSTATAALAATPASRPARLDPGLPGVGLAGRRDIRSRAVSPLRDGFPRRSTSAITTTGDSSHYSERTRANNGNANGHVYVVKLIAVKEDNPPRTATTPASGQGHARSVSDAIQAGSRGLARQRSSTMMNRSRDEKLDTDSPINSLNSHPSLPSLAKAAKAEIETAPALSRLVLVLEHAPLGTMDRFLRTSPDLVGKGLWQRWAVQTTDALDWVHGKGIVHADIKAGNLLLTASLDIRLSDFGSSLLIHPSHPPTDGVGLGTLPFSPPELVDPEASFSFPVDIFSLGATLYQCITGREPYRGCRTIEMMHHVRKGGIWPWEERERISRIGQNEGDSGVPSPYPSAWRGDDYSHSVGLGGVRRAGSLRVPTSSNSNANTNPSARGPDRPRLGRMGSTESLRASEDTGHTDSPAAVKMWGKWISNSGSGSGSRSSTTRTDPISILLAESPDITATGPSPSSSTSRPVPTSLRVNTPSQISPIDTGSNYSSPTYPDTHVHITGEPSGPAYSDGTPAMFFLDGGDRVDEEIWKTLRAMMLPDKESRPSAGQLRAKWDDLGLGQDVEGEGNQADSQRE